MKRLAQHSPWFPIVDIAHAQGNRKIEEIMRMSFLFKRSMNEVCKRKKT